MAKKQYSRGFPGRTPEHYGKPFVCPEKFETARQMELESILLLKNDGILPLKDEKPVAVFGNGQLVTNTGGGGSGGGMGAFSLSFMTAMDDKQLPYVHPLTDYYRRKREEGHGGFEDVHGWDDSDASLWGTQQFSNTGWNNAAPIAVPELKLPEELVSGASKVTDTALVFLSRTVGTEEMDRGIPQPSDWYLNPSEIQMISQAVRLFRKVTLIVSSSGSIDFSWLHDLDPNGRIGAIVLSYGAGSWYGDVLTDLLYGKANFSAKLTDTITKTIEAHHTTRNFGGQQSYASNGTVNGFGDNGCRFSTLNGPQDPISIYQEYVYMGYRYFDTFRGSSDDVLFPFGFGLSYSTFRFDNYATERRDNTIDLSADVTNTSGMAGKAVLEVYVSCPNDGALDQPYQKLVGFAKTKQLAGGETARISVSFTLMDLASYSEELASYVLEKGVYLIRVGDSSRNTSVCAALQVEELVVLQQLKNRLGLDSRNPDGTRANQQEFDALRLNSQHGCDPIGDPLKDAKELQSAAILSLRQEDVPIASEVSQNTFQPGKAPDDHVATLQAVVDGTIPMNDFVDQLTTFELACLLDGGAKVGQTYYCPDDPGVALTIDNAKPIGHSTGAGTSRANARVGIPGVTYCDGSCGIGIRGKMVEQLNIDPNPGYPKAPGIAASWNQEFYHRWGETVAAEMHSANIDIWLAPSINLHRNPLGGRNAEYYSEDPNLSGIVARNVATAVAEAGLTVCCKHFACNDQEQYRRGRHTRRSEAESDNLDAINSITSERALREINLKPFEMAIRTGAVRCVMSAFNKINGWYCSACPDLLIGILREEWGFEGFVVTDWGDYDEIADAADELAAGNDVIMSGKHSRYSLPEQVFAGLRDGRLTRERLLENASNMMRTVCQNTANIFVDGKYNTGMIGSSDVPYHVRTPLEIQTSLLPPAIVGLEYSGIKTTPLFAGGDQGTTCYRFSVSPDSALSAEALAALGLTIRGSGRIAGVPRPGSEGTYPLTIRVESDYGTADRQFLLSIEAFSIQPETLPEVRLGVYYEQSIAALCGESDVQLRLEGALPAGLSFEPTSGIFSGWPEETDLYRETAFTVFADGETVRGQRSYQLRTENYLDVAITPPESCTAEVGTPLRIPFRTTRGTHPGSFLYSVKGALPKGLRISGSLFAGYMIEGVPLETGTFDFFVHVEVEDSVPPIFVEVPYQIRVKASSGEPLTLQEELPDGRVSQLYNVQLQVSGGIGKKRFELVSVDRLPDSFRISETGQLSCAPQASESGLYSFCVRASDESGASVEKEMTIFIAGVLDIQPEPKSEIRIRAGERFQIPIRAAGGFNNQFQYRLLSAGSGAVTLDSDPDFTGKLQGTLHPGRTRVVFEVDEAFAGSPVTSIVYYDLIAE